MFCFPVGDNQDDLVSRAWWGGRGLLAERKLWAALTTQEVGTGTPRDLCLLPRLSSVAATPRRRAVTVVVLHYTNEALWKTARVRAVPWRTTIECRYVSSGRRIYNTCIQTCLLLAKATSLTFACQTLLGQWIRCNIYVILYVTLLVYLKTWLT